MNVVVSPALRLHKLTVADNPAITHAIRQVSTEYGLTADKDYAVIDPSLDELYQIYSRPGHAYWMIEYEGEVIDGSRIAPLTGSESDIYELQKIYFLPAIRGKGLAEKLTLMAVKQTRGMGFKRYCLETTTFLEGAIALYKHLGSEHIDYTFDCTGHVDCEIRVLRKL